MTLRAARESDEPGLVRMLERVSRAGRSQRFFGATDTARAARQLATVAAGDLGLVAQSDRCGLVAHGALYRTGDGQAEVAFLVREDWQGRGAGALLLSHLAEAAAQAAIDVLVATVRYDNRAMISVFEHSGLPMELRYAPDSLHITLSTAADAAIALAA